MTPPFDTFDFQKRQSNRGHFGWTLGIALVVLFLGGSAALSYYVDALWFASLGYGSVFWKTLNIQTAIFGVTALVTFLALYGAFRGLKPARFGEIGTGGVIIVNDRPVRVPVGPVLSLIAVAVSGFIALGTAAGMAADWPAIALWWYGSGVAVPSAAVTHAADPIFGRPMTFYLFTLPVWQAAAGWLLRLALLTLAMAIFFFVASSGGRLLRRDHAGNSDATARGLALAWALFLLALAAEIYLGRFDNLLRESPDLSRDQLPRSAHHVPGDAARLARARGGARLRPSSPPRPGFGGGGGFVPRVL